MKPILSFIGDISLNDTYNELYRKGEKPFAELHELFFNTSLVIGNLECMAAGDRGENLLKNPRLKTDVATLNYLKDINLGLALLANNHAYDNLDDGFARTVKFLNDNNIACIGAGLSPEQAAQPYFGICDQKKFCILNYVTGDTNPKLPDDCPVFLNWFEEKKVVQTIAAHKQTSDIVIVCLHWGGRCEDGLYPDWNQPAVARGLIDAGADLIVGTHSHTLQPCEIYKGAHIIYSLGNFCFSSRYFEGSYREVEWGKKTESAVALFDINTAGVDFVPFDNRSLFLHVDMTLIQKLHARNRKFRYLQKSKALWSLYFFKLKRVDPYIFFLWGNDRRFFTQLKKFPRYIRTKVLRRLRRNKNSAKTL